MERTTRRSTVYNDNFLSFSFSLFDGRHNPGFRSIVMSATTFYAQAAEVLAGCFSNRNDLDAVLDRDKGFAPRWSKMCQKRPHELKEATEEHVATPAMKEIAMLNTWDLVQLLMSVRKTELAPFPSARAPPQESLLTY
ncbi:NUP84_1 [Sanghuangporus weigelae]